MGSKPVPRTEQATRGRTRWAAWEDEIVLKYLRKYDKKVNDQIATQIRKELKYGRTVGAIMTRMRVTIIPKINAQSNKQQQKNATKHVDKSQDANMNLPNKQRVYTLFNKLIRYYHGENNKFDAKNLEDKMKEFKKKKWNGCVATMNVILLNTPLKHFEDKLIKMEQEYGTIDLEKEQQIMDRLNTVKKALNQCLKETNKTINKLKKQKEEKKISQIVKEETVNMPTLEEADEIDTEYKHDNVRIKQEHVSDDSNSESEHRERRRGRRRSRSRSRDRYHHHYRHRSRRGDSRSRHNSHHRGSRHRGYGHRRSYSRSRSRY